MNDLYKDPFEDLFKFPTLMVDGLNEQRKTDEESDEDMDIILCKTEVPYWDFLCIQDGWAPTKKGVDKAITGDFDCSTVTFKQSGTFVVPWKMDKFKKELMSFIEGLRSKDDSPIVKPKFVRIDISDIKTEANDTKE